MNGSEGRNTESEVNEVRCQGLKVISGWWGRSIPPIVPAGGPTEGINDKSSTSRS